MSLEFVTTSFSSLPLRFLPTCHPGPQSPEAAGGLWPQGFCLEALPLPLVLPRVVPTLYPMSGWASFLTPDRVTLFCWSLSIHTVPSALTTLGDYYKLVILEFSVMSASLTGSWTPGEWLCGSLSHPWAQQRSLHVEGFHYLKLVIKYSITMIKFNLLNLFALLYFFWLKYILMSKI